MICYHLWLILTFCVCFFTIQLINNDTSRKKSDATILSVDDSNLTHRKTKIKKEPTLSTTTNGQCVTATESQNDPSDLKDEPGDFIETNCHWRDCGTEFPTQDDLVKVINY